MTLDHAIAEDRAGHIERAADLYERVVRETPDIDALINLAVLYWCSTDFGFWSGHQLRLESVQRAADRFPNCWRLQLRRFRRVRSPRSGVDTSLGRTLVNRYRLTTSAS